MPMAKITFFKEDSELICAHSEDFDAGGYDDHVWKLLVWYRHLDLFIVRCFGRRKSLSFATDLQKCSHLFGQRIAQADFKHAYATVCSQAWGIEALQMLALVPFVDFFNHESYCQALLSYDEEQGFAEVLANCDYAVGTQVFSFLA
ncbi:hypothetical protein R1flu_007571 [Riccia fluitans]|uniref:Uncharacterized protein n=1 Tax=Riccia fluitans TaxID=41844 RepID=A0ABD1YZ93_9MARC